MELPRLGDEPSKAWFTEFKKLPMCQRLDLTAQLAERLGLVVSNMFPTAEGSMMAVSPIAVPSLQGCGIAELLKKGDEQSTELYNIAMRLEPEATLEAADDVLASDAASKFQTQLLLRRLKP